MKTVRSNIAMITRPIVAVIVCFGILISMQSLVPKAWAFKKSSNVDEFMVEDQRTHKRQNYVVQKARINDIIRNIDNTGVTYDTEPFDPEATPEELTAFIVDYANMIRNDVILLDNSVETRTRKRGNLKVEKYNQALPDPPCNCEYIKDRRDLGENIFPRWVETKNCSTEQQMCSEPYICKEILYDLSILKRSRQVSEDFVPKELQSRWTAVKLPISVGCICASQYIKHT